MGLWDLLKMLASLALVLGLMGLLLWTLRQMQQRLQQSPGGRRQMRIVETLSVGPRQKIALLEIDQQRVVVGITAQQMNVLAQWPMTTGPATQLPKE